MTTLTLLITLLTTPLSLENQFIRIRVNPGPEEEARFALDTTQGNPEEPNDDEKKLVYGAKMPWSSFAIVKVDEETFIFGGKPREDRKNFFKNLKTGEKVSGPYIEDEKIISIWRFGGVEIKQVLSFQKGYSTNLKDAMGISYFSESIDGKDHDVGIILVLDTMLGANDGAPLRAEGAEGLIESEICFEKENMPEFWQAWDTENEATIKAEGRLKLKDKISPEKLVLANWGKLAKTNWEIDCEPGSSFVRDGDFEDEKDTAVAIIWKPAKLESKSLEFYTTYGIADAPAPPACKPLSAYISGKPFEIGKDEEKSFFGNWTIDNEYPVRPTEAKLTIYSNDGLKVLTEEKTIDLTKTPNGYHSFKIFNPGISKEKATYTLRIESPEGFVCENTNTVKISKPAELKMTIMKKPIIKSTGIQHDPTRFYANLIIENSGETPSEKGSITINNDEKILIASNKKITFPGILPNEKKTFSWLASILPESSGETSISWTLDYLEEVRDSKNVSFEIPSLSQHMRVRSIKRNLSNSLVTGINLDSFSSFYGKWELPGKCEFVGKGSIENYGYKIESNCYENIVEITISGNYEKLPPLTGLFRVFHSGNPDENWNRLKNCININSEDCETLEEIWQ